MVATEALKVNAGYCAPAGAGKNRAPVRHRLLRKRRVAVDDLMQRTVAKTDSHSRVKVNGMISVPITNWRMVRPRENTRREQADKRRPRHPPRPEEQRQLFIHSTRRSKAKLFSVMPIKSGSRSHHVQH